MGTATAIQWTDHTYNPWVGCVRVSAGCDHCYMFTAQERYGQDPTRIHRTADATFDAPLTWRAPARVFTCSWSDFFVKEADLWRPDAWTIVRRTPHLTYQILTKRPGRIHRCLPPDWGDDGYPNVWLGTSVEAPDVAFRVGQLTRVPAAVHFVSAEPLLAPLNDLDMAGLEWLIVGGESGPGARPMEIEWATDLVARCRSAGVAPFVKQVGAVLARRWRLRDRMGGDPDEWPAELRIRDFPAATAPAAPR